MGDSQTSEKKGGSRKSLIRDARGAVAVYVAIVAPVLFGVGALTLDVGRLITLHTELQAAADAAAIAGAVELNRSPGAIEKAKEAAADALANIQTFATGTKQAILDTTTLKATDCGLNPALGTPCIRFLRSLPQDDSSTIPPTRGDDLPITGTDYIDPTVGSQDSRDEEARFIDVHIEARDVTNILVRLLMLMGQTPLLTSTTSATAVAGQDQVICEFPAMWMCNPSEPLGNTNQELEIDMTLLEGRQMRMFLQANAGGGGGSYTPGNWGLLCPNGSESDGDKCGGSDTAKGLASTDGNCVGRNNMTVKPGVTLPAIRAGINVRLDYYTSFAKDGGNSWRDDSKYMPAANVTQGGEPKVKGSKTCEYEDLKNPNEKAMGLPRDTCFPDGCGSVDGNMDGNDRIGNGEWNYPEYFRINHPCNPLPKILDSGLENPCNKDDDWKPADWDTVTGGTPANPTWPPTRYDTYRYEIESTPVSIVSDSPPQPIYTADGTPDGSTGENGGPQCYTGDEVPGVPGYNYFPGQERNKALFGDRRVFPIAVVNCIARGEAGLKVSGRFSFERPTMAFVFITEPVPPPNEGKIPLFVEALGKLDDATLDDLVKDIVQIYRRGR
ncbi:MAG: hypothetical protein IID53_11990 [Proteobacteria bacterium]|nr:hypothetical protein [Pseudomonadota bacterium]